MIIESLLDVDFYKLTMMNVVYLKFPEKETEYAFFNRTKGAKLHLIYDDLREEIEHLGLLRFQPDEIEYLRSLDIFDPRFLGYLKTFKLNPLEQVSAEVNGNYKLSITIKGKWLETILYETYILAIVNELYFRQYKNENGMEILREKFRLVNKSDRNVRIVDFGTRRRFSKQWQEKVLKYMLLRQKRHTFGTSNVHFAKELDMRPFGTMAHEYIMAFQSMSHIRYTQRDAFRTWIDVYQGKLGIALTDTLSCRQFLKEFDRPLASVFMGVRHDSAAPKEWAEKMIKNYNKKLIESRDKYLVFSDGLTVEKAWELNNEFRTRAHNIFGIGTNLMNDCGHKPLNIVMKMTYFDGLPVAKLSDNAGKETCPDKEHLAYIKKTLDIRRVRSYYSKKKGDSNGY
jgi:nicotinate phosphoribosyltransferase